MKITHQNIDETISTQLKRHKRFVDPLLTARITKITDDHYISDTILQAIEPGRRLRPFLFYETLIGLGGTLGKVHVDVMTAIELLHTASILVDDVLDRDDLRHGIAVVERRWGNDKAVLFSHLIVANTLKLLSFNSGLQQDCLKAYQDMCEGELYDMIYPPGEWQQRGYNARVYRKTSSLFEFLFSSAYQLSESDGQLRPSLASIGRLFGEFYQLSNDFYDWQAHNLTRRRVSAAEWPITFSFPLATYLQTGSSTAIDSYLEKSNLTREEWGNFLRLIWTPAVHDICERTMKRKRKDLESLIFSSNLPARLRRFYIQILDFVSLESCWYSSNATEI